MEINYKAIGRRVKIARIKKELSQDQVSNVTGISNTYLSNIENGRTKPSLPTLIKIANALTVSVDELLCDNIIRSRPTFEKVIADILNDCNEYEIRAIAAIAKTTKEVLRKTLAEESS
jgi:transcriptional regulator with XRE-family HTH domain